MISHPPVSSCSQPLTANRFPLATPPRWVGRVVPNPPFADRATYLPRHPILSTPNGGLGEPRPTMRLLPITMNQERRTRHALPLPLSPCHRASMPPRASACPRVTVPACPLAQARVPMSPCPRAPSVAYFFLGDGKIPALGNVTNLNSPPEAATQRLYRSCGSCDVV